MEAKKEVKVFKVVMMCPKCGEAEMEYTGITFSTSPLKNQHLCPMCGYKESYTKTYPSIEYEEVNPVEDEPLSEE